MASHYLSINRGVPGAKDTDFTYGTASTATDDFEFRILDGKGSNIKDTLLALEAFQRFLVQSNTHIAGTQLVAPTSQT